MSESIQFTSEATDYAWQAACEANDAFDRVRAAETKLASVREVAALAISGITIEEQVYTTLATEQTDAQQDFERYVALAAPVMKAPDSPFKTNSKRLDVSLIVAKAAADERVAPGEPEQAVDFTSQICDFYELERFAELRGYVKGIATRAFRAASRGGVGVEVDDLSSYVSPISLDSENLNRVRHVYEKNRWHEGGIDKATLLYNVSRWVINDPRIPKLGAGSISLWADYCNHAFPDLEEPLPVTHPPKLRVEDVDKGAKLRELEPSDLLLDKVALLDGSEMKVVSVDSLRRYAFTLGYNAQNMPQLSTVFGSIVNLAAPDAAPRKGTTRPHKVKDWLVYTGWQDRNEWGILPDTFKEVIEHFETESSTESRRQLKSYTEFSRAFLRQYLEALTQILPQQPTE